MAGICADGICPRLAWLMPAVSSMSSFESCPLLDRRTAEWPAAEVLRACRRRARLELGQTLKPRRIDRYMTHGRGLRRAPRRFCRQAAVKPRGPKSFVAYLNGLEAGEGA
jgi:hypothetical protein